MSQTETCFNKKISLCIPMYNESSIIADTAKTLHEYMSATFPDYEIIFSNDGSTDGCDRIVEEMNLPNVRVVGYPDNRGKGCAVRTALLAELVELECAFDLLDVADHPDLSGILSNMLYEGMPREAERVLFGEACGCAHGSENSTKRGYRRRKGH